MNPSDPTYMIVRFYHPSTGEFESGISREMLYEGLMLDEALDYCRDPASQKHGHYIDRIRESWLICEG